MGGRACDKGVLGQSRSPPLPSILSLDLIHPTLALRSKPSGRSGRRVWGPQGWTDGVERVRGEGRPGEDATGVEKTQPGKMETGPGVAGRMEGGRRDGKVRAAEGGREGGRGGLEGGEMEKRKEWRWGGEGGTALT